MSYFLFNVWRNEVNGYDEILVGADSLEEAEEKLQESNVEFDDYSFEDEMDYSDVII